jgi:hypothetical protein
VIGSRPPFDRHNKALSPCVSPLSSLIPALLHTRTRSVETLGRVKNNMRELERKLEEQAARGLDLSQIQSDVEAVRAENVALEEKARRSRRAR